MEKGIDNGRMEWRPSSVDLGSFESSRGKGFLCRRILGWWSRLMSFSSSMKMKGNDASLKWSFWES
jgi:hypothetical protein